MKVAITGSSGMIGTALAASLRADGHEVVRLVRRPPRSAEEVRWDPQAADGAIDPDKLAGVDACVNLAGVGVGDRRWTASYKALIRSSRIPGTRALAGALARLGSPPATLVAASAIGWYGDTGEQQVDESGPPGNPSWPGSAGTGRRRPSPPPTRASASCTRAAAWCSARAAGCCIGCCRWPGWACCRGSVRVPR